MSSLGLKSAVYFLTGLLVLVNLLLVRAEDVESPFVTLAQGSLKGRGMTSVKGRKFLSFQGIPYAKPPVGELRFKAPQPAECWEGVRDATAEGDVCPQMDIFQGNITGSEDCLFLNVFTPQLPDEASSKYDVMVLIPGGGFVLGSGNVEIYGPNFLLDEDVLLVTINYRIGALGFLSTEDAASPGNYGLKDQVQALRWVKENIAVFGGNPDSVTIIGPSAGAASVHLQILSPMAKDLFQRAIIQSGSGLSPWATSNGRDNAFKQGRLVNCTSENSEELMDCLREVEANQFINTLSGFEEYGASWNFPYLPAVEREVGEDDVAFLPDHPQNIIRKGEYNKVPIITGMTSHEGIMVVPQFVKNPPLMKEHLENFDRVGPVSLMYERNTSKSNEISRRIKEFYFGEEGLKNEVTDQTLQQFINVTTDRQFSWGLDKLVKEHLMTSSTPIYEYEFIYEGRFGFFRFLLGDKVKGVAHGDDMTYIFSSTRLRNDFKTTDPDFKLVERFVKMWTNFAKSGNPTPEMDDLIKVTWEPATVDDHKYLEIGSELKMKRDLLKDRIAFWDTIDEFINSDGSGVNQRLETSGGAAN